MTHRGAVTQKTPGSPRSAAWRWRFRAALAHAVALPAAACVTEDVDPDLGAGGTGGPAPSGCSVPADGTVASFPEAGAQTWTTMTGASGGFFTYPDEATAPGFGISYDTLNGTWNVHGVYGQFAGFGMWFACKIDASTFSGVRFTASDPSGALTSLKLLVYSSSNWYTTDNALSTCMLPTGVTADDATVCENAFATVPVTTTPTAVRLPWATFTGGIPEPTPDPTEIVQLQWDVSSSMGTTIGLVLDDIGFYR